MDGATASGGGGMMRGPVVMEHVARTRRRKAIAEALRGGMSRREAMAHFGVSYSVVHESAREYGLPFTGQGRRPRAWPDIPDHLRTKFRHLRRHMSAADARALLEGQANGR